MFILREEAGEDIRKAYEWYEEKSTNLGVAFISDVEAVFETVEKSPKISAKIFKNIRRALCKRFPYSVYFIERKSHIIVVAILHQKRHPDIWRSRV